MVASNWVNLEGETIGQKYRLGHLIEPGSQEAWFSAEAGDAGTRDSLVAAVSTRKAPSVFRPEDLRHPNLRRVFASGSDTVDGLEIRYAVLENVGESLSDVLRRGPLDERAARELALAVVSALNHLHRRGFVYAGLRPSTVAQSERGWVLSDFDLLRRKGSVDPAETRLMLAASPHVPPDAYGGLVSPAWDLWSLGVVLNQALTGAPERSGRRSKPSPAPPPFDSIIRGCLDPDPNERIGLRDVAELLGAELDDRSGSPAIQPHAQPDPPAKAESMAPAAPAVALPVHKVRGSGTEPQPVSPPSGEGFRRRRSRIYATRPAEQSVASSADPDEITSGRERIDNRGRRWPIVALGVLALGVGVLLAIVNTREGRENASGRVEELRTATPKPDLATPAPQRKPPPEPAPPANPAARKAAIIPFVIEWNRSMRELDLDEHVDAYAPVVDVFFTKRAVPSSEVRAEKEKFFSGISEVRRLGVRRIRIESFQPERAVVSFRRDWDFRGQQATAGAGRERLTLRWIDGKWRITGEQEIEVYWTRKSRAAKGD